MVLSRLTTGASGKTISPGIGFRHRSAIFVISGSEWLRTASSKLSLGRCRRVRAEGSRASWLWHRWPLFCGSPREGKRLETSDQRALHKPPLIIYTLDLDEAFNDHLASIVNSLLIGVCYRNGDAVEISITGSRYRGGFVTVDHKFSSACHIAVDPVPSQS
jgi:hypothetical protein